MNPLLLSAVPFNVSFILHFLSTLLFKEIKILEYKYPLKVNILWLSGWAPGILKVIWKWEIQKVMTSREASHQKSCRFSGWISLRSSDLNRSP